MNGRSWVVGLGLVAGWGAARSAAAQRSDTAATARADVPHFPWRDSVRFGEGLSVGAPHWVHEADGPPTQWCLAYTGPASSATDMGTTGATWLGATRSHLRDDVLADTTELGNGWRKLLGGAPRATAVDSLLLVTDEATCHAVAETLNRELLGRANGPPPVVVFRLRDFLIAFPPDVRLGEWGVVAGLSADYLIRGAATW